MPEDAARAAALTATLEAAFERVLQQRMQGVALLNLALQVRAVGLTRRADGHWLGALVTPWFLNLVLLPPTAGGEPGPPAPTPPGWPREGQRRRQTFAAAELVFLGGWEEGIGAYQSCALFSDMRHFASPAEACEVAREVLAALDRAPPAATTRAADRPQPPRRRFLFGRGAWARRDDD